MTLTGDFVQRIQEQADKIIYLEAEVKRKDKQYFDELEKLQDEFKIMILAVAERLRNL